MHARELVELAGILSAHGPMLVGHTQRLSESGIQQYWTTSKCRLDRWTRSLRSFHQQARSSSAAMLRVQWPWVRSLLEEILAAEVLTRVWTAVLCLADRQRGSQDAEAVARSVLIGHIEARYRVLTLLVHGPGVDAESAVKLNHLRRRTERWTDLLVGHLAGLGDVAEFSIEPDRAREFARDMDFSNNRLAGRQAWLLMLASLRAGFRQGMAVQSPNADLNAKIAAAILSCFPAEMFDSTGLFHSLWLTRLYNTTDDVQGMIENLLRPEPSRSVTATDGGNAAANSPRWKRFRG
jgi:hypothetical protein